MLVVVGNGLIEEAHGGFGGFLGMDVDGLVGTSVFDHVSPAAADELAMYFIENVTESGDSVALPLPFRLSIVDVDGIDHPVDIIPTGSIQRDGHWRWTVMIVPLSLNGSIIRSLDLEMAGAPRNDVRRMLCEELLVDNDNYTSRWVLVDLEDLAAPTAILLVRMTSRLPPLSTATSWNSIGPPGMAWLPDRPVRSTCHASHGRLAR